MISGIIQQGLIHFFYKKPLSIVQQEKLVTVCVVGYERVTNDHQSAVFTFLHSGSTLSYDVTNTSLPDNTSLFTGLFSANTSCRWRW